MLFPAPAVLFFNRSQKVAQVGGSLEDNQDLRCTYAGGCGHRMLNCNSIHWCFVLHIDVSASCTVYADGLVLLLHLCCAVVMVAGRGGNLVELPLTPVKQYLC